MSKKIQAFPSTITSNFYYYLTYLSIPLSVRCGDFLSLLLFGILFAVAHRRTVTTWIRAAKQSRNFRQAYYHLPQIGRKSNRLLQQILTAIIAENRLLFETAASIRLVADDSPTKHYGKKIEGCGWHYNPTPGGTDAGLCWGHSWVVICLVLTHPLWGEVSFPIATTLYIQQKVIDLLRVGLSKKFK
jgi:hypothetical protein